MRSGSWLIFAGVVLVAAGGCALEGKGEAAVAPAPPVDVAPSLQEYASDPVFRRRALEDSLVTRDNAYARLRLAQYDEDGWGALPELDPSTTPLTVADAERSAPASTASWSSVNLDDVPWETPALHALGEYVFYNYPVQLVPTLSKVVSSPDRGGMWVHEERTGAAWARMPDGRALSAFTCSTCHASLEDGVLVPGRNNADIDVARLDGDGETGLPWGRGRVDVTGDGILDPIAITDLRPIRWQNHLHHAATLKNDPVALAVRIETLIITSLGATFRPPRKVVAGLVVFLLDLAPATPRPLGGHGAEIFAKSCAGCHRDDAAAGDPLLIDQVGTDETVGRSPDRGTGFYRVPSLRFVGDRRRLFASGAIEDVNDLLTPSPDRAAKGHTFGLGLPTEDRAALLDYLRQL